MDVQQTSDFPGNRNDTFIHFFITHSSHYTSNDFTRELIADPEVLLYYSSKIPECVQSGFLTDF